MDNETKRRIAHGVAIALLIIIILILAITLYNYPESSVCPVPDPCPACPESPACPTYSIKETASPYKIYKPVFYKNGVPQRLATDFLKETITRIGQPKIDPATGDPIPGSEPVSVLPLSTYPDIWILVSNWMPVHHKSTNSVTAVIGENELNFSDVQPRSGVSFVLTVRDGTVIAYPADREGLAPNARPEVRFEEDMSAAYGWKTCELVE